MLNEIPVRCYGVSVFILNKDVEQYQTLLLKRNDTIANEWCQVAGKVEKNEKAWEAALRELREETGIVPDSLYSADICEQFYEIEKDSIWLAPVFVAFSSSKNVVLNEEHSDFQWVSISEALERMPFASQRKALRHIEEEFILRKPSKWLFIEETKSK